MLTWIIYRSSNIPSSSSSSMCSGLLMSHSIPSSIRFHMSFESSKLRFIALRNRLGFIAGLLIKIELFKTARFRASPNKVSDSIFFVVAWPSISEGMPFIGVSLLSFRFCIPLAVCVNSFSSFSSGGDVARWFLGIRPTPPRLENDPVGVGGVAISSSSNSGEDKSTSGDGESSLLRSASASSDLDAALEIDGDIIALVDAYCEVAGSGIG